MARHWMRVGSIAAVLVVCLLVLASINLLRPDGTISKPFGVAVPEESHEHEQTNRPQDKQQDEAQQETPATDKLPNLDQLLDEQTKTSTPESTAGPTSGLAAEASPTTLSKAIVMGKLTREETDWVGEALPEWQNAIYVVDLPTNATSPTGLRTKINKSKEAMPYLTYIIDNYPANFPDLMVFLHSHRKGYPQAWHNDAKDYDAVNMLHDLRLDTVMERGYVNLRCVENPGCPDEIRPWRDPPNPEKLPEQIYPYVYADFFNLPLSEVRKQVEVVATPCCAQFAVSRAQILKRPKEEYERYRTYLEETTYDDDTIGRVLEYMWHIIFGREAVHCERASTCHCEVFGRCSSRSSNHGLRKGSGGG
ncbi:hypothetical protein LTR36_004681 [Oleoguttula mirabilis]|uniref:Uncharacterized protein n=1 Tax=Oleoguttula mirabilis TaxID=1507867 RepID=A0AAV9JF13_9PEZI|nr:hypothetical protein LTR36_004681 [Oleoguttula mirabilis]